MILHEVDCLITVRAKVIPTVSWISKRDPSTVTEEDLKRALLQSIMDDNGAVIVNGDLIDIKIEKSIAKEL